MVEFFLFIHLLHRHLETVLLSVRVQKYNKDLKRQERALLITSKAIYNIKLSLFSSIFSVLRTNIKLRRKIELTKLTGVSVSSLSSEFVLHVASEYDYRYASPENREKIILTLHKAFYMGFVQELLPFYFHVSFTLKAVILIFIEWIQSGRCNYHGIRQEARHFPNP